MGQKNVFLPPQPKNPGYGSALGIEKWIEIILLMSYCYLTCKFILDAKSLIICVKTQQKDYGKWFWRTYSSVTKANETFVNLSH